MEILVTGGSGFIGCNLVKFLLEKYPEYHIYNLDSLTYAGGNDNLLDVSSKTNYTFLHYDICDGEKMVELFQQYKFDRVMHLAAESHVDRSIENPGLFATTNIIGTINLLHAAKSLWKAPYDNKLFYFISTDEVYGSLQETGFFTEESNYAPNSPYSASKAGADHFVRAYYHTYKMPCVISHCSNNYGEYQYPEKLIPLCINNILANKPLSIYGNGQQIRDWLYVQDHVIAMDIILHRAEPGDVYNIGGCNEWTNIDLVMELCDMVDRELGREQGMAIKLITHVTDRPGHDIRYAIDASKIATKLGWTPSVSFKKGLEKTVKWYLSNTMWLNRNN